MIQIKKKKKYRTYEEDPKGTDTLIMESTIPLVIGLEPGHRELMAQALMSNTTFQLLQMVRYTGAVCHRDF